MTHTSPFSIRGALALLLSFCTWCATAQLRFEAPRHDFGTVVWQSPVTATFHFTNVGSQPLTIRDVRPDCGCTVVNWPRTSIAPGAEGIITATFDAALLGHFEKQMAVTVSDADKDIWLTISGDVVMKLIDISSRFPCRVGDLYLDADNIEFDDVQRGDIPQKALTVYNGGRQSIEPSLMHLPKYLTVTADPAVLRPGRTGRLLFTLNSNLLHNYGLTQTSVYLSRFSGDRVHRDNEIGVSATLLPPVAVNVDIAHAPQATLDSTLLHMGSLSRKKKLKAVVNLTNTGHADLHVSALQVYNPGLSVSLSKRHLKPGESAKLRIAVSAMSNTFKGRRRVLLITNDPAHPKIVIDLLVAK